MLYAAFYALLRRYRRQENIVSLADFIRAPEHFVARERMLHMKAALEIKVAGASSGIQLQITEPEIDNLGYDFTICWRYDLLCIQNKATISDAGVSRWDFHPLQFQIPFLERDLAPQIAGMPIGGLVGAAGGALIHRVSHESAKQGRLEVDYFYFDVFFASAVMSGLWESSSFSPDAARRILMLIEEGREGGRVSIPLSAMLPITSPSAIIALRFGLPRPSNYVSLGKMPFEDGVPEPLKNLWRAEVGQWVPEKVRCPLTAK